MTKVTTVPISPPTPTAPRAAVAADRPAVKALLASAGLPVDDLGAPDVQLWLMEDGVGGLAGCVGLERHGAHALLRSLAVAPEHRGAGLAVVLVEHARQAALDGDVGTLWALTRDAEQWFRTRGWHITDRAAAPDEIRATRQFSGLCPASATLLKSET